MSSLARRPNGRWRARYRDADGVERARHFRTKTDAQRWLDEITADKLTGRYVDPRAGTVALAEYYHRYAARQLWEPTTRRAMDHAVLTSPLAARAVGAITAAEIETWVKAMVTAGLAPSTVRTRVAALRTVLAGAVRDRLRHDNPATGVRLPRATGRAREVTLPTARQVTDLIAAASPQLRLVIDLAAHAGLRVGEIRGLQVRDVDLVAETVTVRRQVRDTPGGGWQTTTPKYGSVRTIPLPRHLTEHLRRHLTEDGLRLTPETFLLRGRRGGPVAATTLARGWQATKAAAGVDAALRLHDLRHYYASSLIAAGLDVIEVQHRLGHARPSTTLDVYGHRLPRVQPPVGGRRGMRGETSPFAARHPAASS